MGTRGAVASVVGVGWGAGYSVRTLGLPPVPSQTCSVQSPEPVTPPFWPLGPHLKDEEMTVISKLQHRDPDRACSSPVRSVSHGAGGKCEWVRSASRQEANLADSEEAVSTPGVCADAEGLGPLPIQDAVCHEGVVPQVWVLGPQPAHQGARPSGLHHGELVQALEWMEGDVLREVPGPPPSPSTSFSQAWLGEGWGRLLPRL